MKIELLQLPGWIKQSLIAAGVLSVAQLALLDKQELLKFDNIYSNDVAKIAATLEQHGWRLYQPAADETYTEGWKNLCDKMEEFNKVVEELQNFLKRE